MNYIIDLKNADKQIIEDIKVMLKMNSSVKFKIRKAKSRLDSAIKEVERGETIKCKDFEDFKVKVLS